jgi:hypothetical protein
MSTRALYFATRLRLRPSTNLRAAAKAFATGLSLRIQRLIANEPTLLTAKK